MSHTCGCTEFLLTVCAAHTHTHTNPAAMEDATEASLLCMLAQEGEGSTALIYEEVG